MKILLTALFMGAIAVLHAQQAVDPPQSSSMRDQTVNATVPSEKTIPNTLIMTLQGEKPLADFRQGGSSQFTASQVLDLSTAVRESVFADLANFNVSAALVSMSQVSRLPESEQAIVRKNPALFILDDTKEAKQ